MPRNYEARTNLTEPEWRAVTAAAAREDRSVSNWLRRAALSQLSSLERRGPIAVGKAGHFTTFSREESA